ncbi:hypothetical protein N825_15025 [Skermanella stibiiresistens SB22]|uniref:Uncharacterized protein n=1 Tax=Skermanella stibiiresistens SB22 TaxID=1385369 RepID=W9GPH2_9PROT|nr:hypothetical protein N825_15025 [Skermanella stibiiresistens SB22]
MAELTCDDILVIRRMFHALSSQWPMSSWQPRLTEEA